MRRSAPQLLSEYNDEFDTVEPKERGGSFRNRKGIAEAVLLGCSSLFFAMGVMLIVLFASQIQTRCMINTIDTSQSECTIRRSSAWIAPGYYWYHKTQTYFTSEIQTVSLLESNKYTIVIIY